MLHDPLFILKSEDEFETLLSDLGVKRKDLEWAKISEAHNYDSVELIYGDNIDFPAKIIPKKVLSEYWKERKGQSEVSEKIEFISFPKPHNLDVVIYRREYWKINKNLPSGIERTEYTITIPGVSIGELVNDGGGNNTNTSFLQADVEKALDLLRQTGLIEPAIRFQGHMRYKVKDEDEHSLNNLNLRNFISILKAFHDSEFGLLEYKWKHFEGPTSEERKRWTWLLGEREASKFFNEIEIIRCENRKDMRQCMRQCKNIEEYHKFLNIICPKEFSDPFWGPWPTSYILHDFKRQRQEKNETAGEGRSREKKKEWEKMAKSKENRRNKKRTKSGYIKV